jgi:HEXXH motif-containing protein
VDAKTILWTDTDVYQLRYEKTATALMAVERALRARCPLDGGEDEFLSLYDALAAADPETFTEIWEDPLAYFWTRFAYELVGWCLNPGPQPAGLAKYCAKLGTDEPPRALALHLEEFKKFIIALDMKAGGIRRFDRPLRTMLPFSIPGTRFSVLGRGTITVTGVSDGMPEVAYNETPLRLAMGGIVSDPAMPRLVERPVARHGDLEIMLKPETFCVPGVEAAQAFLDLADDYQAQQIPLLQEGLALVERHQPAALEHIRDLVQVIAFKPPASGNYSNVSFSDLPGAFILSAVHQPYWMADALIHEFLHNRLFFVLDRGEILEGAGDDTTEGGEFYSPWRDDLRPPGGLLHAVYVYVGVCKFWFSVCASGDPGVRRDYAEDQAVRAVLDLKIGIAQLRRHATFTEAGMGLFPELEREVAALCATMHALKLSPAAPATIARGNGEIVPFGVAKDGHQLSILESILAHAEQFDTGRQCGDLKLLLNSD